jgi:hypothetical protein
LSRYRISKETGIAEATLSRFMVGRGGLSLQGIDAIGLLLGLEIKRKYRATVLPKPLRTKGS